MNEIELLEKIERLRRKMIEVATEKGFSSDLSVKMSRELDELLNQYEKINTKNAE